MLFFLGIKLRACVVKAREDKENKSMCVDHFKGFEVQHSASAVKDSKRSSKRKITLLNSPSSAGKAMPS